MNKNFLIIAIIAAIIAIGAVGFILGKYYSDISKEATKVYESEPDVSKITEKETGECASIKNINVKNQCWRELAKEEKDESYCKKISADFPEIQGDCYTELAILKNDSLICEKVVTASLHGSCLEYFEDDGEKDETANWKIYRNEKCGFEIVLLDSWKGYSILKETWNGVTLDGKDIKFKGPQIVIRHPKWTLSQPWQDIPIMVFTNEEWKLIEAENLSVSAAPIGPKVLDQNQNYVFALPPRWVGFTDNLGQDEATEIVKTFKAFNADKILDWKTYQNKEYGYEIKYPEELSPYEITIGSKSEIIFGLERYEGEGPGIWISVRDNLPQLSPTDFWIDEIKKWGNYKEVKENTLIKNTSVSDISAIRIKTLKNYTSRPFEDIYVAYNTKMYIIHTNVLDNQKWKNYFNQMLSTFKFTE